MPRCLRRVCTVAVLLAQAAVALAEQQTWLVPTAGADAGFFREQVGRRLTFICAADVDWSQDIWGTDVYADFSPICTAAAHAGIFTPGRAAQVTIVLLGPAASFEGTQRNGVSSQSYGPWEGSFAFGCSGEPGQIDWSTSYGLVDEAFQEPVTVTCPPGGNTLAEVWGTDVFTYDSAICVAAVHAGAITPAAGGTVTVTRVSKQDSYEATERNGVSSRAWPSSEWGGASPYRIDRALVIANIPTAAGARCGLRATTTDVSRMIALAGITARGTSVPVAARTISLAGITARGTSAPIVARTIRLAGITATGTSAPVAARTISLAGITARGTSIPVAARTIRLEGITATGTSVPVAVRTISLAGITATGTSTPVAARTITLVGWNSQGFTGLP
jgi:hypothetical protein